MSETASIPAPGQIARVRQRTYLVEEIVKPKRVADSTLVRLSCVDDDNQGQQIEVLWEKEIAPTVLTGEAWEAIAKKGFDDSRLFAAYLNTLKWNCVTSTDPRLFQSPFRAGIRLDAYQLEPLRKALRMPRVNLFIADDVGLGKTIEAGLIARELLLRKKVREIFVSCPPSMLLQWQEELSSRFGMTFEILDKDYMKKVRRERGFSVNPWSTHTRFLVSNRLLIDETYAGPLRDLLGTFRSGSLFILDEAHHAAPSSGQKYAIDSQITRAIRDLAPRFEHRLFLSATPHNGHSNSFSALLEILDPQRFCRGVPVTAKHRDEVIVRRLKEDIREIQGGFPKRNVVQITIDGLPSDAPELKLASLLDQYRELREERLKSETKRKQAAAGLLIVGLQQRLLSSIEAFTRTLKVHCKTVQRQWEKLQEEGKASEASTGTLDLLTGSVGSDDDRATFDEEQLQAEEDAQFEAASIAAMGPMEDLSAKRLFEREQKLLQEMTDVAEQARGKPDARVKRLIAWIREKMCPDLGKSGAKWNNIRVLIFTEYDDTKRYLVQQLQAALVGTDFAAFTRKCLSWEGEDLKEIPQRVPLPEALSSLEVILPQYHETLRPTHAVPVFKAKEGELPWQMLAQVLPAGTNFDEPSESDSSRHWNAAPQLKFERLLRETQVPIGLLCNSRQLRLVYAPRGESSGHATFNVAEMVQVAGRPMFAALHMLLSADRMFSLADNQRLPAILANSRKYQNTVSTKLAEQVLAALYELMRGFQAANDVRQGELLREILANDPNHVYSGLLTVLMRLVFVLYAEDRDLMSGDPVYSNNYSVTGLFNRLREDRGRYPDTMDLRFGAWSQLLTLFRLVFEGGQHGTFKLPARKGYLFDPDRYPFLEGRSEKLGSGEPTPEPRVSDGVVYRVLRNLLILEGERLSYRTLDVEQIGSVYETIMGFDLHTAEGKSIAIKPVKTHGAPAIINLDELLQTKGKDRPKWIKSHTDHNITGEALKALKAADSIKELLAALDKKIANKVTPRVVSRGAIVLQPSDERRRSGSHYTPRSLTKPIVETTLRPILKQLVEPPQEAAKGDKSLLDGKGRKTQVQAVKSERDEEAARLAREKGSPHPRQILNLKVCDPAMGSGAFLVETCRQLGDELVAAWHAHDCVPTDIPPDEDEVRYAQRLIAQRCLYPASSIRERIYAIPDVGYGVLLFTASSDAEGTLGGLVQVGRRVHEHVRNALELGELCSNDPVCAQHEPANPHERRFLHGAACHGCLLISETSCEHHNEFLDRALAVPTVDNLGIEFFQVGE